MHQWPKTSENMVTVQYVHTVKDDHVLPQSVLHIWPDGQMAEIRHIMLH